MVKCKFQKLKFLLNHKTRISIKKKSVSFILTRNDIEEKSLPFYINICKPVGGDKSTYHVLKALLLKYETAFFLKSHTVVALELKILQLMFFHR